MVLPIIAGIATRAGAKKLLKKYAKGTLGAQLRADKASATKTAMEKLPIVKFLKEHAIKPFSKKGNYVSGNKINVKDEFVKQGKSGFTKKSFPINTSMETIKKWLGYSQGGRVDKKLPGGNKYI
mgnify:CR=1 FL=1|tara:strand:- start:402 stop:773 length:372 start_codon:yes stop_codon:yes gene_type:complete